MTTVKNKNEIDMLNGPLAGKIMAVAFPLAAINILQQLFNAADVAVVGRFANSLALAAVGANTPVVNMFITFFTGLATGGNVLISTMIGKNDSNSVQKAIRTAFALSLVSAAAVLIIGQIIASPILKALNTPDNILPQAVLYLRIYLFAVMFAVIYNFASAILRSKGDTKRPLYCLAAAGVLNIILNLIFVIVFSMDVVGVALATLISNIFCAAMTLLLLYKEAPPFKLSLPISMDKGSLLFILKIGVPAGIQGMLFSISNMFIQSGINSFGSDCIAGNTAAMNFEFIAYFIVYGFGQTAVTFVGQNYGAGQKQRCRKVFRNCLGLGFLFSLLTGFIFYIGQNFWLSFFTTEAAVVSFASIRMLFVVLPECLTSFNEMPAAALRGMGVSITPTVITILGSCVFRIIWMNTIFKLYPTITILMIVYPVSWILISTAMLTAYFVIRRKR